MGIPHQTHKPLVVAEPLRVSTELQKIPQVKPLDDADMQYLQLWYDDKMPGVANLEYKHDQMFMESSDTHLFLDSVALVPGKGVMQDSAFGKLRPVLRTIMQQKKNPSQKESLLGAVKRNLNAPKLANAALSPAAIGKALFDNFVKSAIDPAKQHVAEAFRDDVVNISSDLVDKWLEKQPPSVRSKVNSDVPMHLREYNRFSYMVKRDVKPQLEPSAAFKYPSVQTIAYNDKSINAVFCPVFGVLFERLLAVMSKKILILTGMSNPEFEREFNRRLSPFEISVMVAVENDMSKYDKAQDEALRVFEDLLWEYLGLDPYLAQIWTDSHVDSTLTDKQGGVSFKTRYQRKSGDATTFCGNTAVVVAVMLAAYDIDDIELLCAAGDDSVLYFRQGTLVNHDPSRQIADLFNLECKLMDKYMVPYFCSKFLVTTESWTYLIPDPLKFVTKLGRLDMSNHKHVEEYRVSCVDTMKTLFNPLVAPGLSVGVKERYKGVIDDVSKLICILHTLCNDPKLFAGLFIHDKGIKLCYDPSASRLS